MAVTINTNVSSLVAQSNLSKNTEAYQKAMEQVSSGLRINRASDDAAGLSISESIKTQLNGNQKAISNIANGQNLLNVAEGGEITVTNHLQRIRELCVQAANETYTASDKDNILQEIKQRLKDINNIADSTTFNGVKLLDGTKTSLSLQIGANSDVATNSLDIGPALTNVHISVIGEPIIPDGSDLKGIMLDDPNQTPPIETTGANWSTTQIRAYMKRLDQAITTLSSNRALLGAYGNRLQATSSNLTVMNQNLSETNSRILDADIASSSSDLVKYQILQQTSASILTQANQLPSIALKLLQ